MRTNVVGQRFGRLVVKEMAAKRGYQPYVHAVCDCGNEKEIAFYNMKQGKTTSCGCFRNEQTSAATTTHGLALKHPAYSSWSNMKQRCNDPNKDNYAYYGGRGISVAPRWSEFAQFWEDMKATWFDGATLDRVDSNGNYEPSNCRWVTMAQQQRNKSTTKRVETPFGVMCLADAADRFGINYGTLKSRIKNGMAQDRVFGGPFLKANSWKTPKFIEVNHV